METLIAIVFLSQIFVVSVYFPIKIFRYSAELTKRYPETEYPLLYTLGTKTLIQRQKIFLGLSVAAAIASIFVLFYFLNEERAVSGLKEVFLILLAIQYTPVLIRGYWEIQEKRLRRNLPKPSLRKASLNTRSLRDLVSPALICIYLGTTTLVLALYIYAFSQELIPQKKALIVGFILISIAGIILFKIIKFIRDPRIDPYASVPDQLGRVKKQVRTLVVVGMLICVSAVFPLLKTLDIMSDQNGLVLVSTFSSLCLQALFLYIAFQVYERLDTVDYEIYRPG